MYKMGFKYIILVLGISQIHLTTASWQCTADADCSSLQGSACAGGSCQCPTGTQSVGGGTKCAQIAPYYASECYEDYQCSRLFTSYQCRKDENSEAGHCACQPGHHYLRGRCWPSLQHGDACARDEECFGIMMDPFSMTCNGGVCGCGEGYYLRQRGECRKAANAVGERCVVDDDCVFENGACDIDTLLCYEAPSVNETVTRTAPNQAYKMAAENKMVAVSKMASVKKMASNYSLLTTRQHGDACDVSNGCPAPFECLSGVCVCPIGYYAEGNSDKCYAELGSPSTEEQCVGFLAEVKDGVCTCPSNFAYDDNMRDCVKMARVITDFCQSSWACRTFGGAARCAGAGAWGLRACACDLDATVWDPARNLCRYFSGVGDYCEVDSDCYAGEVPVTCSVGDSGAGVCSCPAGYDGVDGLCLTTGLGLGDQCSASQECTGVLNSECVDGVCACGDGYSQGDGVCAPKIGVTCARDADCAINNTVCLTADGAATCQCHGDFVESADECWPVITSLNSTCQVSAQCAQLLGAGASCQNDMCTCQSQYHMRDGMCWPVTGIFETCSRSSECYLESRSDRLVCRNGFCQCDFEYPYIEELRTCASSAGMVKGSLMAAVALLFLLL